MKDCFVPLWLDRRKISPNHQGIWVLIRHLHCPYARSCSNIQNRHGADQRCEVQMPASKEHDDMMFNVNSLQFGLSRPPWCQYHIWILERDCARCGTRENHATLWRTAGGNLVRRTSSLGNGYDPALYAWYRRPFSNS